jgi:hypothetical protein
MPVIVLADNAALLGDIAVAQSPCSEASLGKRINRRKVVNQMSFQSMRGRVNVHRTLHHPKSFAFLDLLPSCIAYSQAENAHMGPPAFCQMLIRILLTDSSDLERPNPISEIRLLT